MDLKTLGNMLLSLSDMDTTGQMVIFTALHKSMGGVSIEYEESAGPAPKAERPTEPGMPSVDLVTLRKYEALTGFKFGSPEFDVALARLASPPTTVFVTVPEASPPPLPAAVLEASPPTSLAAEATPAVDAKPTQMQLAFSNDVLSQPDNDPDALRSCRHYSAEEESVLQTHVTLWDTYTMEKKRKVLMSLAVQYRRTVDGVKNKMYRLSTGTRHITR